MSRISWRAVAWTGVSLVIVYALAKAALSGAIDTVVFGGLLIGSPFVLGPIGVKLFLQIGKPRSEPFEAARHKLAPDNAALHRSTVERLRGAGYEPAADLWQYTRRRKTRVTLLTTAEARDVVVVTAPAAARQWGRKTPCTVEFRAVRPDRRELWVNNRNALSAFVPSEGHVVEQLPAVRDPLDLRRVHQTLVKSTSTARGKAPDLGKDASGYLVRDVEDHYRRQVAAGYLVAREGGTAFRPTLKGAIVLAWKHLPPWSLLRWRRVHNRAAKITGDLGVRTPRAAPTPGPVIGARVWWAGVAAVLGGMMLAGSGGPGISLRAPLLLWVPSNFEGAVRALERLGNAEAGPLMVHDDAGQLVPSAGRAVELTEERAGALVRRAQRRFLRNGFYLFQYEYQWAGMLPTDDPYEVIRIAAVNGASDGIRTDSVVGWLRALAAEQPFVLTSIGYDFFELHFTSSVEDAAALADRVAAFCPDVLTQGAGSVEAVATDIAELNSIFCFWN